MRAKSVRDAVERRVAERLNGLAGPDGPGSDLGIIPTPAGPFRLVVRHAVDLVILGPAKTDLKAQRKRTGPQKLGVVLITRGHPPGAGGLALPGGMINAGETAEQAALREAGEEANLLGATADLNALELHPQILPPWRIARRFDIRGTDWLAAPVDLGNGVQMVPGDLMTVTTQPFWIYLPVPLEDLKLAAGDDARDLTTRRTETLSPRDLAIPDHLAFIREAVAAAHAASFSKGTPRRAT